MIRDAKDTKLNANGGNLPDVSGALLSWFQPIVFGVITKVDEGFRVKETVVDVNFNGVVQPMQAEQLEMKPEGQRSWAWYTVHAEPGLVLKLDDVVEYLGQNYRVLHRSNWKQYGYVEYHMIEDYKE